MGPSQLTRAPRPRGFSSSYRRSVMGWPQPRFPRMFKRNHRRYRQKRQGPAAMDAATDLAALTMDISTHTITTSFSDTFINVGSFLIL